MASIWPQPSPASSGAVHKPLDAQATEIRYQQRMKQATGPDERRLAMLMQTLRPRGEYRKLAQIHTEWRSQLQELEARFPNFIEVIEYLRGMYTLAEHGDGVARLDPMLLNGPPGCGKSMFAEAFGRHIGSGTLCLRMESAQSNSNLVGSADFWSNSKPGEVFTALVQRDFGNPVIVLDEIDKIPAGDFDPMSSLYSLLEPGTARAFHDLSYPWVTLEASRIVWVCTANDASLLPEPVQDRLRCFDIEMPTEHQCRAMVQNMSAELEQVLTLKTAQFQLSAKAVERLMCLSPRRIRQALREAMGRTLYAGRRRIRPGDLPKEDEGGADEVMRPTGFLQGSTKAVGQKSVSALSFTTTATSTFAASLDISRHQQMRKRPGKPGAYVGNTSESSGNADTSQPELP
ncbi:MAG TPA: AAA family ATPase [Noviherbaspirillum sp.]|nr:AAA family ATPase [Noviherbaspirillum sp.]